ncbi:MAG: DUF4340 domain-containing protein [Acidobacteriota bacterium]
MSPKKLLVLTAVVAVLFGFILLFERKMPSTSERESKGDLHWDIPADRIERITIVRGGEKLDFQRADASHWRLIAPHKYPADSAAVSGIASDLGALKRAGNDAPEARPADYGLEKPVASATWVWTDPGDPKARQTRTVEFGSEVPGTDIVAARVAGTQKVLFVPAAVLTSLKKGAEDFQSKDLFGGSSADVSRIDILRGRGRLALVRKAGTWWLSEPLSDLADAGEADRLVGQLTALRAREFVHGNVDLAAQGLNPPLYRVSVTDAKGATTAVDFGATRSDGNAVYAQREGQVLTVDRDIVDDLSKEAVAFRSTRLVDFNRSDVTALEGSFGKATVALAQKDGGWLFEGHPVLAAAADDVESAILGVKSNGVLDDGEAKALPAPAATLSVKMKTGSPWSLTLHPYAGGTAAKVSSRPGGFRVDPATQSQLEAAFRKATVPPTPAPSPSPAKGKT